jgi:hypothetical protein
MGNVVCVGCGAGVPPNEPAVPVKVSRLSYVGVRRVTVTRPGFACLTCVTGAGNVAQLAATHGRTWTPPGAVGEPVPCEGCGRLIALPASRRRERPTCSRPCAVRITPSQVARRQHENVHCLECGTGFRARDDARYCSGRCRQKAYRARTNGRSTRTREAAAASPSP